MQLKKNLQSFFNSASLTTATNIEAARSYMLFGGPGTGLDNPSIHLDAVLAKSCILNTINFFLLSQILHSSFDHFVFSSINVSLTGLLVLLLGGRNSSSLLGDFDGGPERDWSILWPVC